VCHPVVDAPCVRLVASLTACSMSVTFRVRVVAVATRRVKHLQSEEVGLTTVPRRGERESAMHGPGRFLIIQPGRNGTPRR
jgi:hypothetical protein